MTGFPQIAKIYEELLAKRTKPYALRREIKSHIANDLRTSSSVSWTSRDPIAFGSSATNETLQSASHSASIYLPNLAQIGLFPVLMPLCPRISAEKFANRTLNGNRRSS